MATPCYCKEMLVAISCNNVYALLTVEPPARDRRRRPLATSDGRDDRHPVAVLKRLRGVDRRVADRDDRGQFLWHAELADEVRHSGAVRHFAGELVLSVRRVVLEVSLQFNADLHSFSPRFTIRSPGKRRQRCGAFIGGSGSLS